MIGTELAPNVNGRIVGWNVGSVGRVALDLAGLDAPPKGSIYELWFSSETGPGFVSAGTFTSPDDVELWVGVAQAEYPHLWISLEAVDDDPMPSDLTVVDIADP